MKTKDILAQMAPAKTSSDDADYRTIEQFMADHGHPVIEHDKVCL